MATPFKDRLLAAGAAFPGLVALVGTTPFYDRQLPQQNPMVFPAISVLLVSSPNIYTMTGRMKTLWTRVQFMIWGGQYSAGAEMCNTVYTQLAAFLDQLNMVGIPGQFANPNYIVGDRDGAFVQTDGIVYQRLVDAMIFWDQTL